MKKRNMKSRKLESIENKDGKHNTWYIERVMEMNMTNGS